LIPGIDLFTLNGLGNIAGFIIALRKSLYAGEIAAFFGAIMMIWIILQLAWVGSQSFLQTLYFITGLIQLIAGWYLLKGILKIACDHLYFFNRIIKYLYTIHNF
jgi:hypothetical protein